MAEGVAKSFVRNYKQKLKEVIEDDLELDLDEGSDDEGLKLAEAAIKHAEEKTSEPLSLGNSDAFDTAVIQYLREVEMFFDPDGMVAHARKRAYRATDRDTYQAMEGLVHNLNTMHCLPGSERIWVRRMETGEVGLISMQELNDTFQPGKYEAISVNPKTGEAEFKAITASADQGSGRTLVTIRAKSGQIVRVTDNHKVLSVNKDTGEIFKDVPENIESVVIPRWIGVPEVDVLRSDALCLPELDAEMSGSDNPILANIYDVPIEGKVFSNSGEEHVFDISVADNENFVTEHMIAVSNSRAGAQV